MKVIPLRRYVKEEEISHVMHNRQEIQQLHACPVCGDLQVISGVVFHPRPIEEHDIRNGQEPA